MATFRINEMFIDPALTLIVVEAVEFRTTTTTSGGFMFGSIAPIAVVVCRQDGTTALDMQAKPASVEQLRRDIPELDAVLSA
ncbi:MAG: hypothetical protein OEO71_00035 [Gammaproteobacteria bacterium]|nr:hypothetical protein [Gammaproteobacteria bacterium]